MIYVTNWIPFLVWAPIVRENDGVQKRIMSKQYVTQQKATSKGTQER